MNTEVRDYLLNSKIIMMEWSLNCEFTKMALDSFESCDCGDLQGHIDKLVKAQWYIFTVRN